MTHANDAVVVVGAGGHAAVVIDTLQLLGVHVVAAVDAEATEGRTLLDVPVIGPDSLLSDLRARGFRAAIVAVGDNALRHRLLDEIVLLGFTPIVVTHPGASVSSRAELGPGTVIMAGAVVNARAAIGAGSIVNTGASVDHDCILGVAVHVAPAAALGGNVHCGEESLIGIGAVVLPGVVIGARAIIGGGAAVTSNIAPDSVNVGVPARRVGSQLEARVQADG